MTNEVYIKNMPYIKCLFCMMKSTQIFSFTEIERLIGEEVQHLTTAEEQIKQLESPQEDAEFSRQDDLSIIKTRPIFGYLKC